MEHKVKLIGVKGDVITLRVDGAESCYLIQRPHPLGISDANLLRSVMDAETLKSMFGTLRPQERLYQKFCRLVRFWRRSDRLPTFGESVANYLERVGVEVDIDKKTKGLVILKTDVNKIREEKIGESLC